MSRSINPVHKKKSFIERLINFANHTMKLNKKSATTNHKKKIKNTLESAVINPSLILYTEPIETCTFCDYCDKEIFAKYTGQNIIYHDACKPRNLDSIEMIDIAPISKYESVVNEASHHLTASMSSQRASKNSNCDNDDLDDDDDRFYTARCTSSSAMDLRWNGTGPVTMVPGIMEFGEPARDAYTISTMDMATVRQYGITIRKSSLLVGSGPGPPTTGEAAESSSGTPQGKILVTRPVNDEFEKLPLPDDPTDLIRTFNDNDQGLFIERTPTGQVMGKLRVFVNLIRPIKMLLIARPPSIFDVLSDSDRDKPTLERAYYNREAIFWLPRGTTNLLYMDIQCTTTELITMLLTKYNIRNNPKKFALYEHTLISPTEIEGRKFRPHHCPLQVMLQWCLLGPDHYQYQLKRKRFVLQENDPGSIDWDEFSIPELNSFLKIITQEEQEKRNQVVRQFGILRSEIDRCMRAALRSPVVPDT